MYTLPKSRAFSVIIPSLSLLMMHMQAYSSTYGYSELTSYLFLKISYVLLKVDTFLFEGQILMVLISNIQTFIKWGHENVYANK